MQIAEAAIAALEQHEALADRRDVGDQRLAVLLEDLRAGGYLQHDIGAAGAGAVAPHAVHAGLGLEMLLVAIVDEGVQTVDAFDDHVAAAAAVTAAKPKIADYPFTTLYPGLGVVRVDDREFVLADIPGLIEGAHEGHGLGDRFLGHVERCRVLLHLVDAGGEHAGKAYKTVRNELALYGHGLEEKQEIVALSKTDTVDETALKEQVERLKRAMRTYGPPLGEGERRKPPMILSAATRSGVQDVLRALAGAIGQARVVEKASDPVADWRP